MNTCDLLGLKNKNIVVTGAAGGMGSALVEMLCNLGANVYAGISRNKTNLPVQKRYYPFFCIISNEDDYILF